VSIDDSLSSTDSWILIGPVVDPVDYSYQSLPICMSASIEGIMECFWHVEEPEIAHVTFTSEGCCKQIFATK